MGFLSFEFCLRGGRDAQWWCSFGLGSAGVLVIFLRKIAGALVGLNFCGVGLGGLESFFLLPFVELGSSIANFETDILTSSILPSFPRTSLRSTNTLRLARPMRRRRFVWELG